MKTIIIGSTGLVGRALSKQLPDALKLSHAEIDINHYEELLKLFDKERPKVVYLPAAITNVDACQNIETNVTNVRGAVQVLRMCESFEAKLVYFSSSYVFNGDSPYPYTPEQETSPINNYGKQKETMERMITTSDANALIVRTVGVFGVEKTKRNFAKKIISTIFSGKTVIAPNDQYMNPILSSDLAKTTIRLAEHEKGIFHVAGDRCLTKADFARKIAGYFDLADKVQDMSTKEMKQEAERPEMGCLDCAILEEVGLSVPSLDAGLAHFLELEFNG